MIRRALLLVLAILGTGWLVRRFAREMAAANRSPRPIAPRFEGAMVRDRICQTFLPRSRALSVHYGQEDHFFCSEECREAFLTRHRAAR